MNPHSLGEMMQTKEDLGRQVAAANQALERSSRVLGKQGPAMVRGKLVKRVCLVLVLPKRRVTRFWDAHRGQCFTEEGIENLLHRTAEELEKSFPGTDFRLVELAKDRYNIIHPAAEKRPDVA